MQCVIEGNRDTVVVVPIRVLITNAGPRGSIRAVLVCDKTIILVRNIECGILSSIYTVCFCIAISICILLIEDDCLAALGVLSVEIQRSGIICRQECIQECCGRTGTILIRIPTVFARPGFTIIRQGRTIAAFHGVMEHPSGNILTTIASPFVRLLRVGNNQDCITGQLDHAAVDESILSTIITGSSQISCAFISGAIIGPVTVSGIPLTGQLDDSAIYDTVLGALVVSCNCIPCSGVNVSICFVYRRIFQSDIIVTDLAVHSVGSFGISIITVSVEVQRDDVAVIVNVDDSSAVRLHVDIFIVIFQVGSNHIIPDICSTVNGDICTIRRFYNCIHRLIDFARQGDGVHEVIFVTGHVLLPDDDCVAGFFVFLPAGIDRSLFR